MTFSKKKTAVLASAISTAFLLSGSQALTRLSMTEALEQPLTRVAPTDETQPENTAKAEEPPMTEAAPPVWVGKNFTPTEAAVLSFLQERGITDRAALATILGNIKQESMFETRICEGGARTGYHGCRSGGFGLIQWTTLGRYNGLGRFSKRYGLDPNTLQAQLRWMVNETEWKKVEHIWKTPGKSINSYMNAAYRWLGWGIHGNRTHYAQNYYNALTQVEVEVPADT